MIGVLLAVILITACLFTRRWRRRPAPCSRGHGVLRAQGRVEPKRLHLKAPHGTVAWLMEIRAVLKNGGPLPPGAQQASNRRRGRRERLPALDPLEIELAEANELELDSDTPTP